MFRFFGKTVVVGALTLGALGCLYGKDQILAWFEHGKATLQERIDEFQGMRSELARIEDRVDSLDEEIRSLKEQAIRSEVEVEHLEGEVDDRRSALDRLHRSLEKARTILESPGERFEIGGASYTRAEIERDVADKIGLYEVQRDTLAQLDQTLGVHRSALTLARENVARGEALRTELQGKVRLLHAQLEKHRAREVYAEAVACDFDAREFNTEIGEVRQLFSKFETRLDIEGRMLDERLSLAAGSSLGGIDYEAPAQPAVTDVAEKLSKILSGRAVVPAVAVVRDR